MDGVAATKIVVAVQVLDNADILREYLEWYLALDVHLIVANDFGSTDGSQDILDEFARRKLVEWSLRPDKNTKERDPTAELARLARDRHGADWVIHCDTDEFLCVEGDGLRVALDQAAASGSTVLSTPVWNMTGPAPTAGQNPLFSLTLRIARGTRATPEEQLAGEPPFPIVFLHWPPKAIVRATAFTGYGHGNHKAEAAWGGTEESTRLRFLHYPFRGFEAFQTKVRHGAAWLAANPHLDAKPRWGWHWRRWSRMTAVAELRQEYARQFVSPERAAALIADGTCVIDETVATVLAGRAHASERARS